MSPESNYQPDLIGDQISEAVAESNNAWINSHATKILGSSFALLPTINTYIDTLSLEATKHHDLIHNFSEANQIALGGSQNEPSTPDFPGITPEFKIAVPAGVAIIAIGCFLIEKIANRPRN